MLVLGAFLTASAASLELQFTHTYDGSPLVLDSLDYKLSSGEIISVSRLSYLLSGFALQREDGAWIELTNQFAWIDAERRRSNATLKEIAPGTYRSLRFAVGLDTQANNSDPAQYPADHPLNPNLNGLHWSWQGGYIFLALEGRFRAKDPSSSPAGFSYHFARDPNRTVITLPIELSLAANDCRGVMVDFDIAALLNAPRPISPARDGVSTHSREGDLLAAALRANLANAFQVRQIVGQTAIARDSAPIAPLYLPATFTPFRFIMSGKAPVPNLPRDNPLLVERVELGERLFHEPLLSRDGKLSCASCHDAAHAFSDPRRYSTGVDGQAGARHAMPLFNLAWKSSFFWDGRAPSLRAQAVMPIQDHKEMDESLTNVCAKLSLSRSSRGDEALDRTSGVRTRHSAPRQSLVTSAATEYGYPTLFTQAFGSPDITPEKIGLALENFLLTLTSFDSRFDRAMRGEGELTDDEKRGFELFFTEYEPRMGQMGADCFHCHGGALFSDHQFHNNGLGPEEADSGRFKVTQREADRGKFSTPSLRNSALTGPYMHDGRFETLEEVVEHYCTGIKRSATLDPNLAKHLDGGLPLKDSEKRALVAFLKTLTDERFKTSGGLASIEAK
jgi:cytochrome c peroxidase